MLLTGAKPVAPATKMMGLAQEERAERTFELDDLANLHPLEHVRRVATARYAANLQLDHVTLVRRGGERERALLAVVEQHVDVLSRVEAQR